MGFAGAWRSLSLGAIWEAALLDEPDKLGSSVMVLGTLTALGAVNGL